MRNGWPGVILQKKVVIKMDKKVNIDQPCPKVIRKINTKLQSISKFVMCKILLLC